jgi:hypothetical protein
MTVSSNRFNPALMRILILPYRAFGVWSVYLLLPTSQLPFGDGELFSATRCFRGNGRCGRSETGTFGVVMRAAMATITSEKLKRPMLRKISACRARPSQNGSGAPARPERVDANQSCDQFFHKTCAFVYRLGTRPPINANI